MSISSTIFEHLSQLDSATMHRFPNVPHKAPTLLDGLNAGLVSAELHNGVAAIIAAINARMNNLFHDDARCWKHDGQHVYTYERRRMRDAQYNLGFAVRPDGNDGFIRVGIGFGGGAGDPGSHAFLAYLDNVRRHPGVFALLMDSLDGGYVESHLGNVEFPTADFLLDVIGPIESHSTWRFIGKRFTAEEVVGSSEAWFALQCEAIFRELRAAGVIVR